jgi:molecular chaperone GrpE
MIGNKKTEHPKRIPIRFEDEEDITEETNKVASNRSDVDNKQDDPELTPEEIGQQSSYEDTTEVKSRIDHGNRDVSNDQEGFERADIVDKSPSSSLPENREDTDTTLSKEAENSQADAPDDPLSEARSNKMLAELIATRAELKRVEEECKKAESEKQSLQDRAIRIQADFDNYRKRTEREREETYNRTVGRVVRDLLPVIDNLGRAIDVETSGDATDAEKFQHFLQGVELIYKQLNNVLGNLGLKQVETVGKPFDPHIHEAVAMEFSEEHEPDTVIEELSKGYRINDTLLRPAMVKVSTK